MAPRDGLRQPVSTYDQAQQWLWTHSNPEEWMNNPEVPLPKEALLVCDMFWLNSVDLRADLRRVWTGPVETSRRHYRAGYR